MIVLRALKLFRTNTTNSGMIEVTPRLAEGEADVQGLVEARMEALLGVRFLASEYGTGPVHAGRIDSLGLDENGSQVIVEYKRGVDVGAFSELGPSIRPCWRVFDLRCGDSASAGKTLHRGAVFSAEVRQ